MQPFVDFIFCKQGVLRDDAGIFHVKDGFRARQGIGPVSLKFDGIHPAPRRLIYQSLGLFECRKVPANFGNQVTSIPTILPEHFYSLGKRMLCTNVH